MREVLRCESNGTLLPEEGHGASPFFEIDYQTFEEADKIVRAFNFREYSSHYFSFLVVVSVREHVREGARPPHSTIMHQTSTIQHFQTNSRSNIFDF